MPAFPSEDSLVGCLHGMAVGDALGLPREGLSPRRAARMFPQVDSYSFLLGRGMFSDDTEHACMTAQALLVSGGEPTRFARSLGWRLRWWLLGLPFSIGMGTLKSCIKLWLGYSPRESGVWSAGNGPATRALVIGACMGADPSRMDALVRIATRITHRDPRAEWGALAIARAAWLAVSCPETVLRSMDSAMFICGSIPPEGAELAALVDRATASVSANETTEAFADSLGLSDGISDSMMHTVPIALHAWLRFPDDYRAAVLSVIRCGGDTDSTAAIVGGLTGARLGSASIPEEWRKGLCEWPRDLRWMSRLGRELAKRLADGEPRKSVPLSFLGIVARNFLFNLTVLAHGFRRLLPPY